MGPLRVGDEFPRGFIAYDQLGNAISLDNLLGVKNLVVFFIPAIRATVKDIKQVDVERVGSTHEPQSSSVFDISTYERHSRGGIKLIEYFASQYRRGFQAMGAEVVCVCLDSQKNIADWTKKHPVPFAIVADPDWSLSRAAKVSPAFAWLPKKVSYVVDQRGIIAHAKDTSAHDFDGTFDEHVKVSLKVCQELAAGIVPVARKVGYLDALLPALGVPALVKEATRMKETRKSEDVGYTTQHKH
eukprot:tig00001490_g8969.t1